jgi:hypothetical protein
MARVIYAPSLEIGRFFSQVPQSEFDWRLPFLGEQTSCTCWNLVLSERPDLKQERFSRLFHASKRVRKLAAVSSSRSTVTDVTPETLNGHRLR